MTLIPSSDSSVGMLSTRRVGRGTGLPKKDVQLDSAVLVPPVPFWAGWVLDITYHGGTAQQVTWAQEAVQKCTFPLQSLGVKIDVYFSGRPPKSDLRHPYMVTQMAASNHANIYVEPWADDPGAAGNAGLPNAPNNIEEFYKESFVHELGHVVVWSTVGSTLEDTATRQARQAAYAHLFHRIDDTSRRGTLGDWSDVNLAWADEIQETAAEVFKCAFYADKRKLIYKNRTHWTIDDGADWRSFLTLMEPGRFSVTDTSNVYGSFVDLGADSVAGPGTVVGQVLTQWFMGGGVFDLVSGNVYYDPALFAGGEALQLFRSHTAYIEPPQAPPSGALDHGWGTLDLSDTWSRGSIGSLYLAPARHGLARKGIAKLTVLEQAKSQSSIGIGIIDETGHAWGSVGYNYAFTPPGYDTLTAYGVVLTGSSPPGIRGVPLEPPCKLFIEVDADAGTASAGVMDMGDNIVTVYSVTTLPKTHLYMPYVQPSSWFMLGDDPQFPPPPGNEYSVLTTGECTWTTQPTLVPGDYPFKPPGVVPGAQQSGLVLLN